ncbi:MAG: hypothetical protein WCT10_00875 [Patescibacteria group bacterium]
MTATSRPTPAFGPQGIFLIFLFALIFNAIWENLHAPLYISYRGQTITELILLRAAVVDAGMITLLALPFIYNAGFRRRSWLIIPLGILIAVFLELYALNSARWAYTSDMPLVPFLAVGLTPTLQLGPLGYLAFWIVENLMKRDARIG